MGLVKIFSHSVGCCFVLVTVFFALQKLLSFRRSHLLIFVLSICATDTIFRKQFPEAMRPRLFPTFFSMRFNVTGFMLRFLIHLDLSFVHGIYLQIDLDRFAFFYMLTSSYASTIC